MDDLDKLIELYNEHNNANLDQSNLMCSTCNSWLTSPIYLLEDGENVCGNCRPTTQVSLQNKSLETLLGGTEYPCKNHWIGCDVFEASIVDHGDICDYRFCPCKQTHTYIDFGHATSVHSMKEIQLKKPVAKIVLEPENQTYQSFYFCTPMDTICIFVNVWPTRTFNQIYLFLYNGSSDAIKHTIVFTHDNIKYTQSSQINRGQGTIQTIPKPDAEYFPRSFKIYFEDYENFEPFESYYKSIMKDCECPICLEVITDVCYQCVNGHNICARCKEKATTCSACRLEINSTAVNIKCMPINFKRLCKILEKGSFVHGDDDAVQQYETECDYDSDSSDSY